MKRILILFLVLLASCTTSMDADHSDDEYDSESVPHGHENVLTTFGPGVGPQMHQLSLRQFGTVNDIAKDPSEIPLHARSGDVVKISLLAKEVVSEIAPNITYVYWTFNETVPGPFLRVKEGQTVELTLTNDKSSAHNHSIDLHAVNGPGGGMELTDVAPGKSKTFRFKALNPGLYVYHCATPNAPTHMANGMYGLILVEPKNGLSNVDKEFYVMQGELYTKGALGEIGYQRFDGMKMLHETPEYIVFNGRVHALKEHALNASVGETIRLFVGNGGVSRISSFHVIGEIFDTVHPEASTDVIHNVQSTIVPAGGAAIVEFTVDVPGTYALVDHALSRVDRGAWGLLHVNGAENASIFSRVS